MLTGDDILSHTRPLVSALVEHNRRETGSKMTAYERVARKIGASPVWVRKLLGRQPNVDVAAHQYLNIVGLYRRLCARIEAKAEEERRKLDLLLGHHHAIVQSNLGLDHSPLGSDQGKKASDP